MGEFYSQPERLKIKTAATWAAAKKFGFLAEKSRPATSSRRCQPRARLAEGPAGGAAAGGAAGGGVVAGPGCVPECIPSLKLRIPSPRPRITSGIFLPPKSR